jgi:hypothetical protein
MKFILNYYEETTIVLIHAVIHFGAASAISSTPRSINRVGLATVLSQQRHQEETINTRKAQGNSAGNKHQSRFIHL